ncbi:MAG: GNAT family N-acetyltransferase, partial [Pseudomonas sp.]
IHTYLLQKHGKRAMTDAEKQRDRHLDQLTHKAREFVRGRLGDDAVPTSGPRLRLV